MAHIKGVKTRQAVQTATAALFTIGLISCGGSGGGAGDSNSGAVETQLTELDTAEALVPFPGTGELVQCSVPTLNQWVDNSMRDFYLFADQVPIVNLTDFDSPEELIRNLRIDPPDDFSNVSNAAESSQLFDNGIASSTGLFWSFDQNNMPRIVFTQPNSPAAVAGLNRGDLLVSLEGVPWTEVTREQFFEFVGTADNPRSAEYELIRATTGETYVRDLIQTEHLVNTILHSEVIEQDAMPGRIGYLAVSSFIDATAQQVRAEFARFRENGVTDLVLDLRYNRGGRVSSAGVLASLISSPSTDGEILSEFRFNERYSFRNEAFFFINEPNGLNLPRVVVLTTSSTASASELVINSLEPYIDVVQMGTRTLGKSFASFGRQFCGRQINAMEAVVVNAASVGVFNGLAADCFAEDDLRRDFGTSVNGTEGMLQSAIDYLVNGTCNQDPLTLAQRSLRSEAGSESPLSILHESRRPLLELVEEPEF